MNQNAASHQPSQPRPFRHGFRLYLGGPSARTTYSMSDPESEALSEAMWRMRYAPGQVDRLDRERVMQAADSYIHLTTHPMGSNAACRKLRAIRRALRDLETPHHEPKQAQP